jgi:hypothetical protein
MVTGLHGIKTNKENLRSAPIATDGSVFAMRRIMKIRHLLEQVKSLYPETHCSISHDIRVFATGNYQQEYTFYVSGVFNASFANFNELENFIASIPKQSQLILNVG